MILNKIKVRAQDIDLNYIITYGQESREFTRRHQFPATSWFGRRCSELVTSSRPLSFSGSKQVWSLTSSNILPSSVLVWRRSPIYYIRVFESQPFTFFFFFFPFWFHFNWSLSSSLLFSVTDCSYCCMWYYKLNLYTVF